MSTVLAWLVPGPIRRRYVLRNLFDSVAGLGVPVAVVGELSQLRR